MPGGKKKQIVFEQASSELFSNAVESSAMKISVIELDHDSMQISAVEPSTIFMNHDESSDLEAIVVADASDNSCTPRIEIFGNTPEW